MDENTYGEIDAFLREREGKATAADLQAKFGLPYLDARNALARYLCDDISPDGADETRSDDEEEALEWRALTDEEMSAIKSCGKINEYRAYRCRYDELYADWSKYKAELAKYRERAAEDRFALSALHYVEDMEGSTKSQLESILKDVDKLVEDAKSEHDIAELKKKIRNRNAEAKIEALKERIDELNKRECDTDEQRAERDEEMLCLAKKQSHLLNTLWFGSEADKDAAFADDPDGECGDSEEECADRSKALGGGSDRRCREDRKGGAPVVEDAPSLTYKYRSAEVFDRVGDAYVNRLKRCFSTKKDKRGCLIEVGLEFPDGERYIVALVNSPQGYALVDGGCAMKYLGSKLDLRNKDVEREIDRICESFGMEIAASQLVAPIPDGSDVVKHLMMFVSAIGRLSDVANQTSLSSMSETVLWECAYEFRKQLLGQRRVSRAQLIKKAGSVVSRAKKFGDSRRALVFACIADGLKQISDEFFEQIKRQVLNLFCDD